MGKTLLDNAVLDIHVPEKNVINRVKMPLIIELLSQNYLPLVLPTDRHHQSLDSLNPLTYIAFGRLLFNK